MMKLAILYLFMCLTNERKLLKEVWSSKVFEDDAFCFSVIFVDWLNYKSLLYNADAEIFC